MRKTRRLLLAALVVAAAGVAYIYRQQSAQQALNAPQAPPPLTGQTQSVSKDWVYYKGDGDRPVFEVRAKEMEQVTGSATAVRLRGVDLRLYKKDGQRFDHVESAAAEFDQAAGSLFAEGDVAITLAEREPDPAQPDLPQRRERLLKILTSKVRFAVATGLAETGQPARFEFDLGSGSATGATYSPQDRDLRLLHDVKLDWLGRDKSRPPIHIEAGSLVYREAEAKVHLLERSAFERQTLKMQGGQALVTLEDGAIRQVEAADARGTDKQKTREMDFAAKALTLNLNEKAEMERVLGDGASRVEVRTATGTTELTSQKLLLQFQQTAGASVLDDALAQGKAVLHSRPRATTGTDRTLVSDSIYAKMRPGGEELQRVETRAPGVLDLVPRAPGQTKRHLEAERMWVDYSPGSVMENFRGVQTHTRSERPGGKSAGLTWASELGAKFDTAGTMTTMEQSGRFRYEEGPQRATADKAVMDQTTGRIVLTGNKEIRARAWDATGQVLADTITLDQREGSLLAEGDVVSTREADAKADASGGPLLRQSEPLHGKAARLTMSDNNTLIVHEGGAKGGLKGKAQVWQGANRIEATKVTINRTTRTLQAAGDVVNLLAEGANTEQPAITTVRAAALDYNDAERLAHYTGGVRMARQGLDVRGTQMRAYLEQNTSAIEHLTADGKVDFAQTHKTGWRKGASEHAEYYTAGEKLVLYGGNATMTDSAKGTTRGERLTFTGADDNMVVEGAPAEPAVSRIRRK
jgi:lipopolysaccharide export system protein LptA